MECHWCEYYWYCATGRGPLFCPYDDYEDEDDEYFGYLGGDYL